MEVPAHRVPASTSYVHACPCRPYPGGSVLPACMRCSPALLLSWPLNWSKARPGVVERGVQYMLSLSLSPFLLCIHAALGSAGVAAQADQVYQGQHAYAIMHMPLLAYSRSAVTHSRLYLLDRLIKKAVHCLQCYACLPPALPLRTY